MPDHLLYLKEKGTVWFNPSYGLTKFWDEYRKLAEKLDISLQLAWSHRDLKSAKEIYATCIIAKAMEKQEKTGRWWMLKPKNDPPDGVIGTLVKTNGLEKIHVREVEVVEHIDGEILDTIRKKLTDKYYEPNTILVCFVSKGGVYDFEKESKVISREVTSLDHIFLVFPGTKVDNILQNATQDEILRALFKVSLVQLKPIFSFSNVDPIDDCKDWREGKEGSFMIYEGLGKGGSMKPITLEKPPQLF